MRKFFKIFVSCIVLCLLVSCIFACAPATGGETNNNGNTPVNNLKFGVNLLKDCYVDIEDDDQSLAVEMRTKESTAINNKGYLVCFDNENKLRQVNFVYEHVKTTQTIDGNNEVVTEEIEITQEEIESSVSNLYVTKKFTYITFTPRGYNDTTSDKFTADTSFMCDTNHQSFVIDNETYKLYPTNAIGSFANISENFVYVGGSKGYNGYTGGKYYELTIDAAGNLALRKIVPNDNISESRVMVDKFGQVFVLNSLANETRDNFVYYTSSANPKYLGDDGLVYTIEESNYKYTIKYYDQNLQLQLLPAGTSVRFREYLVKNNTLYFLSSWLFHLKITNGVTQAIYGGDDTYTYNSANNYCIVGREVFVYRLIDGVETLFYFDTDTNTTAQMIASFTDMEISGNSLILTRETIDGTKKYIVNVISGEVSLELLVDITYQNQIITIQPLN